MRSLIPIFATIILLGCQGGSGTYYSLEHEDKDAKNMFQGIWLNDDEEYASLYIRGDSMFFPDTTSLPMRFWIYKDSLYTEGRNINRYKITAQGEHVFKYISQTGDEIRLVKSDDQSFVNIFFQPRPYAINIFRTINRDTIGEGMGMKYRCNMIIEPTSERVIKSLLNDDGMEVDNMYLDNVAKVNVSIGGKHIYSHDFHKSEFNRFVPTEFMQHSILRDVQYNKADTGAVYLDAIIGFPDASTSYVVELKISKNGKLTTRLR